MEFGGQADGDVVISHTIEKLSYGFKIDDLRANSQKESTLGPVAQRQSSGLIIHWS